MTTLSKSYEYSYEYLLKSRQLTWESAEFIDSCFGPIKSEERGVNEKDVKENNTSKDFYETTRKRKHAAQCYSRTENRVKRKIYIHLDYNEVINVRVSLSSIDCDKYINKYRSSDDVVSKPTASFDNTPKDDPSVVASPPERLQGGYHNSCTKCQKKFPSKSHLTIHLRTHTGEKPFSCPQCEKKITTKPNLKKHLLTHSGIKPYSCDTCYKAFAQKSTLMRHRRTHTGDKPFNCTTCNAMFSQRAHLNAHTRTHTGETPYQCEICEKKFARLGHLKYHLLIHSEEKPFACTYAKCEKHFKRKDVLNRHIRSHTENKSYT